MFITNNFSPSFQKVHIQSSEMNDVQRNFVYNLLDDLQYSDEYQKADEENIDLYFLPNEKVQDGVVVKFADNYSDNFYKSCGHDLSCRQSASKRATNGLFKFADSIKEKLNEIFLGKYDRPEFDPEKIVNATTDVAKVNPERYEDIIEDVEMYENFGVSRLSAEDIGADTFIFEKIKHNRDEEF